jgi:hypothetical protein
MRFTNVFRGLLGLLFFTICTSATLSAQTTGVLTGEIKDPNGALIPGVTVKARHIETNLTLTAVATNEGRFVFPVLAVGNYEITAEAAGFKLPKQVNQAVTVGETVALALEMYPTQADVNVNIVDETVLVNTQTSELSYLVGEKAIRDLPLNGRNYTDLALLQPGVAAYPHRDGGSVVAHGLGISINGQDPRANVFLLDGTPQNDFTNGPAGSAAGTVLGIETIREFRVETNAYSAEFGRNSGGQINAVSKSGTNQWHGSLYEFHRNDNFDARNFFDGARRPEFKRNQFGGSVGGPIKTDKLFFFGGYEALRENLGQTISTVVPDVAARAGVVPGGPPVTINSAVRPYLDAFPLPNGANLGNGLAAYTFGFDRNTRQHYTQGRADYYRNEQQQFFARYTFDNADQKLPTDFPQFPRAFVSRNQFFTAEMRQTFSAKTFGTFRFSFGRTRIGQTVSSSVNLPSFVPGQTLVGNIDIGGVPRFGPQGSVNVKLTQNVFGGEANLTHTRGRHLLKAGVLLERYQDNLFNPTFSLGIYNFANLRAFLSGTPNRFVGLRPEGALDRYWRFNLLGLYVHDTVRVTPRLSVNAGLRYEYTSLPVDINGRDSALINLTDRAPTVGPLYRNPTGKNFAPRVGFAWDVFGDGKTSLRGGYGIFFNTTNQQNLIVTITNPPATPRVVYANPTFPNPPFQTASTNSIRPVEFNLKTPYIQVYNLNMQRELPFGTVITLGYAGARGIHLLRSGDVNLAAPTIQANGTPFWAAGAPRVNTAFTTIELKRSDGNSWYNAGLLEVRKRFSMGLLAQLSYTFSRNLDTTQASTFFSDATNGTTSAFPEFPGLDYNKGLADYHAKHNVVLNFVYDLPTRKDLRGVAGAIVNGWQLAGIANARSGNPLTVFVQTNRSRSQWAPSLGPGIGADRASLADGFNAQSAVTGRPEQYFNPAAFVLQPAGTLGTTGRGAFIGPNLRTFDLSAIKTFKVTEKTRLQFRAETFNLFNRANFAPPLLTAFAGTETNPNATLSTFGRIRSTVTSSRQVQFGIRLSF